MAKRTVTVELEEGEILLALQCPEGYEDTHPELLVEDANLPAWLEHRIVEASPVPTEPPQAMLDAVTAALGDAYDCNRTWAAWSYGTMSADDFSMVAEDADRVAEIAGAALGALLSAESSPPASGPATLPPAAAVPSDGSSQ